MMFIRRGVPAARRVAERSPITIEIGELRMHGNSHLIFCAFIMASGTFLYLMAFTVFYNLT